jgi:hypothetical protein
MRKTDPTSAFLIKNKILLLYIFLLTFLSISISHYSDVQSRKIDKLKKELVLQDMTLKAIISNDLKQKQIEMLEQNTNLTSMHNGSTRLKKITVNP